MHADHAFHIGSRHLRGGSPCQDYATSDTIADPPVCYAIVSDGCSTAGHRDVPPVNGQTDIGARITTIAMANAIRDDAADPADDPSIRFSLENLLQWQDDKIQRSREALQLRLPHLYATCSTILVAPHSTLAHVAGDGVLAYQTTDGVLTAHRLDWDGNMPLYPVYRLDGRLEESFRATHGDDGPLMTTRRSDGSPDHLHRFGLDMNGVAIRTPDNLRTLAVFSDGVTQVDGIDWWDVIRDLMAFKSTTGDFVKRRLNAFVRDAAKRGRGPIDDLAFAAIAFEV